MLTLIPSFVLSAHGTRHCNEDPAITDNAVHFEFIIGARNYNLYSLQKSNVMINLVYKNDM